MEQAHNLRFFRMLADSAPAALFIADSSGNWIYVNHSCQQLFLFGGAVGRNLDWQARIHPDDRDRVASDFLHYVQGGLEFDQEVRLADRRMRRQSADATIVWPWTGNAMPGPWAAHQDR